MLAEVPSFSGDNLTGHCINVSTLSMVSRFGQSEEVRMVLGHHSLRNKSSPEAYSRGIQAYLLRVLVVDVSDGPNNIVQGGWKVSASSAVAPTDDDELPLGPEVREWVILDATWSYVMKNARDDCLASLMLT